MAGENFIPAENTARVQLWATLHGEYISNTIYFQRGGIWGEADLNALADSVIEHWKIDIHSLLSNAYELRYLICRDMTTFEAPQITKTPGLLSAGSRLVSSAPGNVAVAAKLKTGFSGRSRQGRIYMSGLDEGNIDGNELDPEYQDQFESEFSDFLSECNTDGFQMCVASFYSGMFLFEKPNGERVFKPEPREEALVTPVLSILVDPFIDSQRRRLEGRGN